MTVYFVITMEIRFCDPVQLYYDPHLLGKETASSFLQISKNCKQPEGQTCVVMYENQSVMLVQIKITPK